MTRYVGFASILILVLGCSQQPSSTKTTDVSKSTTPVVFNAAGAPTVEFSVPDMMCPESCAPKVKEILSKQPGAKEVIVDFPSKTATVAIDKSKFDPKQAIAALVDHQFDHSTLKDISAAGPEANSHTTASKSVQ
ncbi:MAG TPA: heavy-metal-associated domain-containing protein [Lacipirellulaceae bacterium]|nr:heavy-metal-associated domain-containing protein [Lacipirellulaceae bacterium]